MAAVLLGTVALGGCGAGSGGGSGSGGTASAAVTPSAPPAPGATARSSAAPGPTGAPAATPSPPASASGPPASPAPSSAAERLVTVTRSGGFAGRTHTLLIRGDGSWTRLDGQGGPEGSGKLAPDRLAVLRTALAEADFAHLPRVVRGGPTVFDGFTYAFVHAGFEVATADGSVPPGLQKVLAALPPFESG
ncbi:hypothetical protein AB0B01_24260 [Streptomyces sp. NPDC044571]|uniref:hypothetical protein n=1 Tax=Streptomyces sp. NPDC044571 TaxID=3155371 RepID=UPI0033E19247